MTSGGDVAHHVGMTSGDPTEDEKRRATLRGVQHVEDLLRAVLDPRFVIVPMDRGNPVGEAGDLEILLHVKRQRVADCHVSFLAEAGPAV
jgi:hypothetical protein